MRFVIYSSLIFMHRSFLNDVTRIAARDYEPSDDDIVRARLRTTGVQEYRFIFERGESPPTPCTCFPFHYMSPSQDPRWAESG